MTTAIFRGQMMSREPKNVRLAELAAHLACFHTVPVVLEPGDATRYDFTIARSMSGGDRLIVVRTNGSGGDMRAAAFVYSVVTSFESREGITALSCGNEWSADLFVWWFRELWAAIKEAEAEPNVPSLPAFRGSL